MSSAEDVRSDEAGVHPLVQAVHDGAHALQVVPDQRDQHREVGFANVVLGIDEVDTELWELPIELVLGDPAAELCGLEHSLSPLPGRNQDRRYGR